jgi:cell cycle arrest protein BUB2
LRDGPQSSNPHEGLRELKYLVLSSRVDADGDGMVRRTQSCLQG